MLTHADFFSGIGGFTRAGELVGGITTTEFVEREKDAQLVLRSHWSGIPIHDDIRIYSPRIRGIRFVYHWFACTGTSNVGTRTRLSHPESALWRESLRCICMGAVKTSC